MLSWSKSINFFTIKHLKKIKVKRLTKKFFARYARVWTQYTRVHQKEERFFRQLKISFTFFLLAPLAFLFVLFFEKHYPNISAAYGRLRRERFCLANVLLCEW